MIRENKAFVFDFDDTLAFTDAKVHVLSPTRLVRKGLTPQEFNSNKLREGESYDFSDFNKASLILDGKPTKLMDLAKDVSDEGHSVFILTARNPCVANVIKSFLSSKGVKVQEVHCVGGDSNVAKAKRKVLLSIIENFDKIWFFDDDSRNIELASDLPLKAKKV